MSGHLQWLIKEMWEPIFAPAYVIKGKQELWARAVFRSQNSPIVPVNMEHWVGTMKPVFVFRFFFLVSEEG